MKSCKARLSNLETQHACEKEALREEVQRHRSALEEYQTRAILRHRAQESAHKIVEQELSRREAVQQARDAEFQGQISNERMGAAKVKGQLHAERVARADLERRVSDLEHELADQREGVILPLREQKAFLEAEVERVVVRGGSSSCGPPLYRPAPVATHPRLITACPPAAQRAEAEARVERERVDLLQRYPPAFDELWDRWSKLKREYAAQ